MRKVEHIEVVIDRVIYTLDCGCMKKSDIAINAQRLADLKKAHGGREYCEKHNPFVRLQIYICKHCQIVDSIEVSREDTQELTFNKVYIVHDAAYPHCANRRMHMDILLTFHGPTTSRQSIEASEAFPSWAKEPMMKILRLEEKVDA